jgi:hypothetical protein
VVAAAALLTATSVAVVAYPSTRAQGGPIAVLLLQKAYAMEHATRRQRQPAVLGDDDAGCLGRGVGGA